MKKINIAELLKDCPKGMELDSPVWNNIVFEEIDGDSIVIFRTSVGAKVYLTQYGAVNSIDGNCVIFPKGKTTWKGFAPPCNFKNGDIVACSMQGFIGIAAGDRLPVLNTVPVHCILNARLSLRVYAPEKDFWYFDRLATEEEKQKLFKAIKENGYSWNPETKTLEKIVEPKFKVGDRIKTIYKNFQYDIKDITDTHYTLVEVVDKFEYTEPIIEDKNWELVPNKFDITTLKPFDKVLVRDNDEQVWTADMFSFYNEKHVYPFMCVGHYTKQCIPYDQNKHLLGTTNGCDEFYKIWE